MSALPDRDRRVLDVIVQAYIDQGEPVSSLWLAECGGVGVSSATVRNIMARLEEMGYVRQPHTSAGRVPTDLAYRAYVDQLLTGRKPARPVPQLEARLRKAGTIEDLLEHASLELSRVSHHVGFAMAAAGDLARFQHVDFVALDGGRILVIVIATGGQISQKVIELDEPLTALDLQQAANYLNTEFSGLSLSDVRREIGERLQAERTLYDALMARALRLASTTFEELVPRSPLHIQGASALLEEMAQDSQATPIETLRALVKVMEEKHRLMRLLTGYIDGPGLTVVIGREHSSPDLQYFSLVVSTYSDGQSTGAIGLIGPTRMHYPRALTVVESLSQAVSRVLDHERAEE
jgi:heat-inducible transcriptional repressor